MSKVKIQGSASGSGVLTIQAPTTSTDRTITLPDATGTLATTADTFNPDAAVTINESGADVDFRVESDTNTHALFVQGSDGNVGIGTTAPILGKVHLLAAGTSDASLENVAHFGKNSTSRAGLQIRANATQVDVGLQAQAGAGNLDLSFSTLVGGGHYERMRLLSAGGLTFNGDTAAANALDDYEEGTWTPVLGGVSTDPTSVTYPVRVGTYTKIGNMVHASFYLEITAHSGGVGDALIKGLPYVVSNYTGYDYAGGFAKSQIYSQGSYSGGRNTFTISARKNNSYLMFRQYGGTTSVGMTGWGLSQMTGNLYVGGVYTYPVF